MKRLVALLLPAVVLLAGCGGGQGSSLPPGPEGEAGASSLGQSSFVSGGVSSSSMPASSSILSQPAGATNYERTKDLPEGPYTPAALEDVEAGDNSWFHFLDPDDFELVGYAPDADVVLMVRFEQYEGTAQMSCGVYGTDGGQYYLGTYAYLGDGMFSLELGEWFAVPQEDGAEVGPLFTVKLRMEWPPGREDMAVITITDIGDGADEVFVGIYTAYLDVPMAYVN